MLRFALLLVTAAALSALEGAAPWLDHPLTADWRQSAWPLVVADLQRAAGADVVVDGGKPGPVTVVMSRERTLREVLLRLEEATGMNVVVEADRLRFSLRPADDRRQVEIPLLAYGFGPAPDQGGGSRLGLLPPGGVAAEEPPYVPPPESIVEFVRGRLPSSDDKSLDLRSRGGDLVCNATAGQERAIRDLLAAGVATPDVSRWRLGAGILHGGGPLPLGIVPLAEADAVLLRLADRVDLDLTAGLGETARAARAKPPSTVRLSGEPLLLACGIAARSVGLRGHDVDGLDWQVDWVDRRGTQAPSADAPIAAADLWAWRAGGITVLPRGQALVVGSRRGADTAVLVWRPAGARDGAPAGPGGTVLDLLVACARGLGADLLATPAVAGTLDVQATIPASTAGWPALSCALAENHRLDVRLAAGVLRVDALQDPPRLGSGPEPYLHDIGLLRRLATAIDPDYDFENLVREIMHNIPEEDRGNLGLRLEEYEGSLVIICDPACQERVTTEIQHLETARSRQVLWRLYDLDEDAAPAEQALTAGEWAVRRGDRQPIAGFTTLDGATGGIACGSWLPRVAADGVAAEPRESLVDGVALAGSATVTQAGIRLQLDLTAAGGTPATAFAGELDVPAGGAAVLHLGRQTLAFTVTPLVFDR